MADDFKAENYKKSIEKAVDRWVQKTAPLFKQLDSVLTDLTKLGDHPTPDDQKKSDDLKKQRADLQKKIDNATLEFRAALMLLDVPPKVDPKEAVKLPSWFKEIVKKKGLPISNNVTLVPDLNIDFKNMKIKSGSITLKWEF